MNFVNVTNQVKNCNQRSSLPLEEALCLMHMVSQDILSDHQTSIQALEVEDWNRLQNYLLKVCSTVGKLYEKHKNALPKPVSPSLEGKFQSQLKEAGQSLAMLESQARELEAAKAKLEAALSRQKSKDACIARLSSDIEDLQVRLDRLRTVDLNALEQEQKKLTADKAGLEDELAHQRSQNAAAARQIQTTREALAGETEKAAQLKQALDDVTQKLNDAQVLCGGLEKQLQDASAKRAALEHRQAALETEIHALRERIALTGPKVEALQKTAADKGRELADLQNAAKLYNVQISGLHRQLAETQAPCDVLRKELADLQEDLKTALAARSALAKESQNVRETTASVLADCGALRRSIQEETVQLNELHPPYKNLEKKLADLTAQKAALLEEINEYRLRTTQIQDDLCQLEQTKTQRLAEYKDLQDQKKQLEGSLAGLNSRIVHIQAELERLAQEETVLNGTLQELSAELAEKQQSYDLLLKKAEAAQTERRGLDHDLTIAREKEKKLNEELARLQKLLDDLQDVDRKRAAADEQLAKAKIDLANARQEYRDLNGQIRQLDGETKDLQTQSAGLQVECSAAEGLCNQARDQRNGLQNQLDTVRKEIRIQEDLQTELETKLQEAGTTLAAAKEQIQTLKQELSQSTAAYDQMIEEVVSLEVRLEEQQQDNASYRTDFLAPAKQKLEGAQTEYQQMGNAVYGLNKDLNNLTGKREERRKEINGLNTLILMKQKEYDDCLKKLREQEQKRDDLQKQLAEKREELNQLTQNEIQPLIDSIATAQRRLEELDAEQTIEQYTKDHAVLKAKIEAILQSRIQDVKQMIGEASQAEEALQQELEQLCRELPQQEAARDAVKHQCDEKRGEIHRTQEEHDRYQNDLSKLAAREQELLDCQTRLETMKQIRQTLMDISRDIGCGMGYTDLLEAGIRKAETTLQKLRDSITEYQQIWSKTIDQ